MAKLSQIKEDDVSMSSLIAERNGDEEEVELVSDVEVIEELSEEAKKMQEHALMAAKEKVVSIIDKKKVKLAMKEIESVELYAEILNDEEVVQRVKDNVKSAMDLKFVAEAQKIKLQNLQTLLRMDSINESGNAGEIFVGVEFGNTGGGTTKVVVGKR